MANASHKMGPGAQGKHSGTGAMTDVDASMIPDSGVLSNRDKSQHGDSRGLDSKEMLNEELVDHANAHLDDGKI